MSESIPLLLRSDPANLPKGQRRQTLARLSARWHRAPSRHPRSSTRSVPLSLSRHRQMPRFAKYLVELWWIERSQTGIGIVRKLAEHNAPIDVVHIHADEI